LSEQAGVDLRIAVTGAHLSPALGLSCKEIEADGFPIDTKIDILLGSGSASSISKSMGLAMIGFAEYFERSRPGLLLLLGDRYETFAVAAAATNARIPISHLYGGESTEGAVDECYRHSITKISHLHFTSTDEYRRRVIQLGEDPGKVFNVGALGVENALKIEPLSKRALEESINFRLDKPYAVVTFHPATTEDNTGEAQCEELLSALSEIPSMKFIITKANADAGGSAINELIDKYAWNNPQVYATASLGWRRYLSALKYAEVVVGNSSSGLIEAPSFHIPTVNIGDRQKGRIRSGSVIDCDPMKDSILVAVDKARSDCFRDKASICNNPYHNTNTSQNIVSRIIEFYGIIDIKKKFFPCL
jgi:GDP/UDP-N,N'-diacetylbacillosamine 2-epimerase (hydrolysing)